MPGLTRLAALDVSTGFDVGQALAALSRALDGTGPAVLPSAGPPPPTDRASRHTPPGTAAVVATSGSTGAPKLVALGAAAMLHSARAAHERLGGPGQWVLAMPAQRIGGLQVLVRSLVAGTVPVVLPPGPFSAAGFGGAVASLATGLPRYAALVPTQLLRLLGSDPGRQALAALDAVLVGGAPLDARSREQARSAGARVVATYGMTETCGGCVYDGSPLDGVRVDVDGHGRVRVGGAVVALGYLHEPERIAERFQVRPDGERWVLTDDLGSLKNGRLQIVGRVDDLINTGGLKVDPARVAEALAGLDAVREAVVVGVPDAEWGQRVAAVLVTAPAGQREPGDVHGIRQALRATLPDHCLPRQVVWVDDLPLLPSGKPDTAALRDLLTSGNGTM